MTAHEVDLGLELELFKHLSRKHRIRTTDPIYEALKASEHFPAAAKGETPARDALDALASRLLREAHRRRADEARAQKRKDAALNFIQEEERKRAEVTAREYARLARRFPGHGDGEPSLVADFRQRFLRGGPLDEETAIRLLSSPAAALLQAEDFESGQLPLLDHDSTVVTRRLERDSKHADLFWERFEISVKWQGGERTFPIGYGWRSPSNRDSLPRMEVAVQGVTKRLRVYPFTFFDSLRTLSETLSNHYGWLGGETVWFVLTDTPPSVPCLTLDHPPDEVSGFDHRHLRLRITVLPWVSAATVARIYRSIQQSYLGYAQNRPTTIRSLELFDFASERRHRTPPIPWRQIMAEWDKTRPRAERYKDRVQGFEDDCDRIRRQIIFLGSERDAKQQSPPQLREQQRPFVIVDRTPVRR